MRYGLATYAAALVSLACAASASFAQGSATSGEWRVFDSTVLKQQKAWKTDDWNDYTLDETPLPAYLFRYPVGWKFNGSSVFVTSTEEIKIAELAPGIVKLGTNQDCFLNASSEKNVALGRPIRLGKLHGRKVIGQFEDDYSGSTWHRVDYCLSDGEFAFLISFTLKHRNVSMERQFSRVVSSFRLVSTDGK
jgi:hypothetical protein